MKRVLPVSISALSEGASEKSGELGNVPGTGQQPSGFGDAPWPVPGTLGALARMRQRYQTYANQRPLASLFQYPLFRIVECSFGVGWGRAPESAGFNIRSFGSWNAALRYDDLGRIRLLFQYPLFRIVECSSSAVFQ